MAACKKARKFVLFARNVLKFVYLNVFEFVRPLSEDRRVLFKEEQYKLDEVGKIQKEVFALVFEVLQNDEVHRVFIVRTGQVGRGRLPFRIGQKGHIVALRFVHFYRVKALLKRKIAQRKPVFGVNALQDRLLILFVQHHEVGGVGKVCDLVFEYFMAGAVEGEYPAAVLVGHKGADALFHLPRGFVRECHGKDMLGRNAEHFRDVYIAAGEHFGLAAARARRNAHIAFRLFHGGALFFV